MQRQVKVRFRYARVVWEDGEADVGIPDGCDAETWVDVNKRGVVADIARDAHEVADIIAGTEHAHVLLGGDDCDA